jgi:hypothetical protein
MGRFTVQFTAQRAIGSPLKYLYQGRARDRLSPLHRELNVLMVKMVAQPVGSVGQMTEMSST